MSFLDNSYLIDSDIGEILYQKINKLPIVDLHNHGDVKEIVDNKPWTDIWEVQGATDHYVWELMRKAGVKEDKITGNASNKEKWTALAEVFPIFAGNPVYEWVHLDLKRCFNIEKLICAENAEYIWEKTSDMLKEDKMKPANLLRKMNVQAMCTTDDPASDLKHHIQARSEIEDIKIFPTWRPDKYMMIDSENWLKDIKALCERYGNAYNSLEGMLDSLKASHDFFAEQGCLISDHGIQEAVSYKVDTKRASEIYEKALQELQLEEDILDNKKLSIKDIRDFKAFMLNFFGELNAEKSWTAQLHIGAVRDYRKLLYNNLGKDSGGDISTNYLEIAENLKYFLNRFDGKFNIILYCLDPYHLPTMATISRAFPNLSVGAPWWFNDSPLGIEKYLEYIATVDLLGIQPGMVTDSRKLLSYGSRTEVFRRVLANVVGKMVNRGQIPLETSIDLIKRLSYFNSKKILKL